MDPDTLAVDVGAVVLTVEVDSPPEDELNNSSFFTRGVNEGEGNDSCLGDTLRSNTSSVAGAGVGDVVAFALAAATAVSGDALADETAAAAAAAGVPPRGVVIPRLSVTATVGGDGNGRGRASLFCDAATDGYAEVATLLSARHEHSGSDSSAGHSSPAEETPRRKLTLRRWRSNGDGSWPPSQSPRSASRAESLGDDAGSVERAPSTTSILRPQRHAASISSHGAHSQVGGGGARKRRGSVSVTPPGGPAARTNGPAPALFIPPARRRVRSAATAAAVGREQHGGAHRRRTDMHMTMSPAVSEISAEGPPSPQMGVGPQGSAKRLRKRASLTGSGFMRGVTHGRSGSLRKSPRSLRSPPTSPRQRRDSVSSPPAAPPNHYGHSSAVAFLRGEGPGPAAAARKAFGELQLILKEALAHVESCGVEGKFEKADKWEMIQALGMALRPLRWGVHKAEMNEELVVGACNEIDILEGQVASLRQSEGSLTDRVNELEKKHEEYMRESAWRLVAQRLKWLSFERKIERLHCAWSVATGLTIVNVAVDNALSLWLEIPEQAAAACRKLHELLGILTKECEGLEYFSDGVVYRAVFPTQSHASMFALEAQVQALDMEWDPLLLAHRFSSPMRAEGSNALVFNGPRLAMSVGPIDDTQQIADNHGRLFYAGAQMSATDKLLESTLGGEVTMCTEAYHCWSRLHSVDWMFAVKGEYSLGRSAIVYSAIPAVLKERKEAIGRSRLEGDLSEREKVKRAPSPSPGRVSISPRVEVTRAPAELALPAPPPAVAQASPSASAIDAAFGGYEEFARVLEWDLRRATEMVGHLEADLLASQEDNRRKDARVAELEAHVERLQEKLSMAQWDNASRRSGGLRRRTGAPASDAGSGGDSARTRRRTSALVAPTMSSSAKRRHSATPPGLVGVNVGGGVGKSMGASLRRVQTGSPMTLSQRSGDPESPSRSQSSPHARARRRKRSSVAGVRKKRANSSGVPRSQSRENSPRSGYAAATDAPPGIVTSPPDTPAAGGADSDDVSKMSGYVFPVEGADGDYDSPDMLSTPASRVDSVASTAASHGRVVGLVDPVSSQSPSASHAREVRVVRSPSDEVRLIGSEASMTTPLESGLIAIPRVHDATTSALPSPRPDHNTVATQTETGSWRSSSRGTGGGPPNLHHYTTGGGGKPGCPACGGPAAAVWVPNVFLAAFSYASDAVLDLRERMFWATSRLLHGVRAAQHKRGVRGCMNVPLLSVQLKCKEAARLKPVKAPPITVSPRTNGAHTGRPESAKDRAQQRRDGGERANADGRKKGGNGGGRAGGTGAGSGSPRSPTVASRVFDLPLDPVDDHMLFSASVVELEGACLTPSEGAAAAMGASICRNPAPRAALHGDDVGPTALPDAAEGHNRPTSFSKWVEGKRATTRNAAAEMAADETGT